MMQASSFRFEALGTTWIIESLGNLPIGNLEKEILQVVTSFENTYLRFKHDSFVSKLNRERRLADTPDELLKMLDFSLRAYRLTDGLFNITVGGVLAAKGYGSHKKSKAVPLEKAVKYDSAQVVLLENAVIDFGGFGKGWLIDKLSLLLFRRGVHEHIVNGGGDLYVRSQNPIEISLSHPLRSDHSIQKIELMDQGLAGSSPHLRKWVNNSGAHHHLINPQTNNSVTNAVGVFVIAKTALVADMLATAALINPNIIPILMSRFKKSEFLLVTSN